MGLLTTIKRTPTALGPYLVFPENATLRSAARLLRAESFLLAQEGRYREAIRNQARGFRVASHAASDPGLIALLVGIACDAISLAGMEDILYLAGPNAEVADMVRTTIAADRPSFNRRRCLDGEVVMVAGAFNLFRQYGLTMLDRSLSFADQGTFKVRQLTPAEKREWNKLIDAAEADYLQLMRRAIACLEKPYPESNACLKQIEDLIETRSDNPVSLFRVVLYPIVTAPGARALSAVAREDVVMVGAALLAYKVRHGAFPASLEQALPPPLDPFSGKPLQYRREDEGFVVYSVGPNGNFDGGRPGSKREPTQAYFRYPAPPPEPAPTPLPVPRR